MSRNEAETIRDLLKEIETVESIADHIKHLHKDEKVDELARLALKLQARLLHEHEIKLSTYPSK